MTISINGSEPVTTDEWFDGEFNLLEELYRSERPGHLMALAEAITLSQVRRVPLRDWMHEAVFSLIRDYYDKPSSGRKGAFSSDKGRFEKNWEHVRRFNALKLLAHKTGLDEKPPARRGHPDPSGQAAKWAAARKKAAARCNCTPEQVQESYDMVIANPEGCFDLVRDLGIPLVKPNPE